jgi:hypothetical protein
LKVYKNRIPESELISFGRKMSKVLKDGSIQPLKVYNNLLIGNLRTVVPKGIDVDRNMKGRIKRTKNGAIYNLEFVGDESTWKTLKDWNNGTPPVTHAIIKVTPEEASIEAERIKNEYTRKGWDWKTSRVFHKALRENKIIRKLPKPIEGKVGTHNIEKIADKLVKGSLIPELNRMITRKLEEIV